MLRTAVILALGAYVSAQSLSSACSASLSAVALNPAAAACLNPVPLISILSGNSSTPIVPAVDNWLTGICGAPPCSNQTLSQVVANVTTGCAAELSAAGIGAGDAGSITTLVEQYYPTVRQVVCLKDGSTNCVTQTLQNIEASVGTLSLASIFTLVMNPPTSLPSNITCTNCVKAAYSIISKSIPQASAGTSAIQQQCGASFTDGTTPSGISESALAAGASTSTKSAALGSFAGAGTYMSGLAIVSTAFTLLV